MRVGIESEHWNDENGNPAGGSTFGKGFAISWQNGPLGRGDDRKKPNGAFVEDVISACVDRIMYYQFSDFACGENENALFHLRQALKFLDTRTHKREDQGVEGLHEKHEQQDVPVEEDSDEIPMKEALELDRMRLDIQIAKSEVSVKQKQAELLDAERRKVAAEREEIESRFVHDDDAEG